MEMGAGTGKPLAGKVALVTGAGRGIGRVIALRLAQDGAAIVAHYAHSKAGAERTVAEIEAMGGKAIAYQADIARRAEVKALFARIDDNRTRRFTSFVVDELTNVLRAQVCGIDCRHIEFLVRRFAVASRYIGRNNG